VSETSKIILERWPEGDGEEMEFRLVYRGPVPPDKRGTVEEKHLIRRQIHQQLLELWNIEPVLIGLKTMPFMGHPRVMDVAQNYERCGFQFVPMVRSDIRVACALDILLLRRAEPYRIFQGRGDLDNRVKTMIDGLRMPSQCGELPKDAAPAEDERPMFCLLEDDKLIHELSVTTDRLLTPLGGDEVERDVYALFRVRIKSLSGPFSLFDLGS